MTGILVVCTANICRSPVAAAILADALSPAGIAVTSAGTHAVDGAAAAEQSRAYLRARLGARAGADADHRSHRLTRGMTTRADLLLTMTSAQRHWVSTEDPRTVRRSFTLRELSSLAPELAPDARFADLRGFAQACARLRSRIRRAPEELDVADPYGGAPAQYERSFDQIAEACTVIARSLTVHVAAAPGPEAGDDP